MALELTTIDSTNGTPSFSRFGAQVRQVVAAISSFSLTAVIPFGAGKKFFLTATVHEVELFSQVRSINGRDVTADLGFRFYNGVQAVEEASATVVLLAITDAGNSQDFALYQATVDELTRPPPSFPANGLSFTSMLSGFRVGYQDARHNVMNLSVKSAVHPASDAAASTGATKVGVTGSAGIKDKSNNAGSGPALVSVLGIANGSDVYVAQKTLSSAQLSKGDTVEVPLDAERLAGKQVAKFVVVLQEFSFGLKPDKGDPRDFEIATVSFSVSDLGVGDTKVHFKARAALTSVRYLTFPPDPDRSLTANADDLSATVLIIALLEKKPA